MLALVLGGAKRGQPPPRVYYVALRGDDRSSGAAEEPWRHIEWALTRPFLQAGDVIRIRGGIYREAAIRPVASGEPGRPITVLAEPGEAVVLSGRLRAPGWQPGGSQLYYTDYPAPGGFPWDHPFQVTEDGRLLYRVATMQGLDRPGRCYVDTPARRIWVRTTDGRPPAEHILEYGAAVSGLEFRGAQCWRVAGLTLTGFRSSGVMIAGGAGRIELDRLDISYVGAHRLGSDPTNGWALTLQDSSGGNFIHDSRFHHTLAEAVHVSQSGAGGDLFENNDVREAGGAEWLWEGRAEGLLTGPGMIVRGSGERVRGNRFWANGYHGLILESDLTGSEGRANPSRNVIEGNLLAFNGGNGVYGDGKNRLEASAGNILRFNLLDRNNQARPGDGDAELRVVGNLDELQVYNNTIRSENANGVLLLAPGRVRLSNNIVVHTGGVRRTYPLRGIDVGAGVASDFNNWYRVSPGPIADWNGTECATWEEFRQRTGQERRGLSVDPRFVSLERGHFWLRATSPLIGWGPAEGGMAADLGAFPRRTLLEVAPRELRFATVAGAADPAPQAVEIRSAAGIPVGWTARGSGERWLVVGSGSGETPGRVGIGARVAGQTAGVYDAMVQVAPAIEGEPAMAVRVVVTVVPSPPRRRRP